jgi:Dolichyl-phosphate-mannose-protein mannosyltransferase
MSADTPSRSRFSIRRPTAFVPVLLGIALMLTNRWFPAVDDECAIIDRAAQPISYTAHLYLFGVGEHEHPPLYDLILHGWLCLTGGNMHLLRLPAVVFYALGVWVLGAAAKRLAGGRAQFWVLIVAVLWPFGFHFGRVASWYSCCFLLASLLTWVYLNYLERPTLANWAWVLVSALLLVYSNYFGWVLLGFLTLDLAARDPRHFSRERKRLVAGAALLVLAYLPVLAAFVTEIHRHVRPPHSFPTAVFTGIYNLYCIFVSESVAPWFWALGIPAAICITLVLALILWRGSMPGRRFLLYFTALLAIMTAAGIVETKRLLLIGPWLVLSIGVTLGAWPTAYWARRLCLLSLALIAGIGWYGIFARDLYAAPHWVEPWDRVARQAASVVRSGGIVIGNNPSFFLYLTYALGAEPQGMANSRFVGFLPTSLRHTGVYDPRQWLAEGQPLASTVLLVQGMHYGIPEGPTAETQRSLSARCGMKDARRMVYDPGILWKQRFAPEDDQIPWRIRLSTYACPQERSSRPQSSRFRRFRRLMN